MYSIYSVRGASRFSYSDENLIFCINCTGQKVVLPQLFSFDYKEAGFTDFLLCLFHRNFFTELVFPVYAPHVQCYIHSIVE